jgi:hypothetical protein
MSRVRGESIAASVICRVEVHYPNFLQRSRLRPDSRDHFGPDEWLEIFHLNDMFHADTPLTCVKRPLFAFRCKGIEVALVSWVRRRGAARFGQRQLR